MSGATSARQKGVFISTTTTRGSVLLEKPFCLNIACDSRLA